MAMRFNPPPNWPAPAPGQEPQPGWRPDPTWPDPPKGWQLWVDDAKKPRRRGLKIAGAVVGVLVVLGAIGAATGGGGNPSPSPSSSAGGSATPTAAAAAAATSAPGKAAPEPLKSTPPAAPLTPMQKLAGKLQDQKATAKKSGDDLVVTFPVQDNFTKGLIRAGLASSTYDILKAVREAGVSYQLVTVKGVTQLVDQFGHESKGTAYSAVFSRGTVNRLEFDNLETTSLSKMERLTETGLIALLQEWREKDGT
jgi:hypothetical protein